MVISIKRKLLELFANLPASIKGVIYIIMAYFYRLFVFFGRPVRTLPTERGEPVAFPPIPDMHTFIKEISQKGGQIYGRELLEQYEVDPAKNILMVSHDMSMSGAPIVLYYLAVELQKRGYKCFIVSPVDGEGYGRMVSDSGIPVIHYPKVFNSNLLCKSDRLFGKVVVNTLMSVPTIKMFLNTDMECIWWIHEGESFTRPKEAAIIPRKLTDNIKVYCVSSYSKRIMKYNYPMYKTSVFPYFSPDLLMAKKKDSKLYEMINSEKTVYAIIGSTSVRKGQDILAKAIKILPKEVRDNSFFVFVGGLVDAENETKKMQVVFDVEKSYPDNVICSDYLNVNQVYKLYEKIDFLICASRDDPLPVVTAEAMSMSIPCICSENTGTAAIINRYKCGFVYKNNSSRELAKRIVQSYGLDWQVYTELGSNARTAYDKYFDKKVFDKHVDRIFKSSSKTN